MVTPTGEPIGKATVRLAATNTPGQQGAVYVEISSSDGRFIAERVAPGRYNVSAQRTGYVLTRTESGATPPISFDLAAGDTKSGVEIRLTPLAVLSGVVTDADGDPVPGAQVRLLRYAFNQGHLTLTNSSATNGDDRGVFRLPSIQPGRYYLIASSVGVPPTANEVRGRSAQEMNLPTYYPNSADARGAVAITVASTEVANLSIRLRRGGLYSIRGTFIGPDGGPLAGGITVFPKGGDSSPPGMTSQTRDPNIFQLGGLPAGDYTLVVRSNLARPAPAPSPISPAPAIAAALPNQVVALSGRADVTLGNADLDNVTIRMSEGAEITGRISIEGGIELQTLMATITGAANRVEAPRAATRAPAGGSINALVPAAAAVRMPSVILTSIEGPAAALMSAANSDGTFRIPNIPALKRVIQVTPLPPGAYVKSVRFRGLDATRTPLDLSTGAGGVLDILIGTKGGDIVATTRNDKGETPQGGAPISIWPRTPNPGSASGDVRYFPASAAAVRAQALAPGEYYVAAWETSNAEYVRDPAFLARFTALASKVSVAEGESITVEPRMISREALEKESAQYP